MPAAGWRDRDLSRRPLWGDRGGGHAVQEGLCALRRRQPGAVLAGGALGHAGSLVRQDDSPDHRATGREHGPDRRVDGRAGRSPDARTAAALPRPWRHQDPTATPDPSLLTYGRPDRSMLQATYTPSTLARTKPTSKIAAVWGSLRTW